jgi:hypothetical protein
MNAFNALACLIWGAYYHREGSMQLAYTNYAGVLSSVMLVPGVLLANGILK